MILRKLWLFPLTALLGAAVAVLPALAAPESSTIEATTGCSSSYPSYPCWTPSTVTIMSGGVVEFANKSSTLEQGVRWAGNAPACEGVPSGDQKGPWEGSCTFTQPGTYRFQGTQNYSYPGEVIVSAPTVTTTTGSTTTPTTSTPSALPGSSSAPLEPIPTSTANSLLAGSATSAVKLAAVQRGQSVHGSIDVSQGGAGGRLEVELLVTHAALASARHAAPMPVGRLLRSPLGVGVVSFTVALNAEARHALHTRHRLVLSVKVLLTSVQGSAVTVTRSVTVRS